MLEYLAIVSVFALACGAVLVLTEGVAGPGGIKLLELRSVVA
jgi:hypothetical protein